MPSRKSKSVVSRVRKPAASPSATGTTAPQRSAKGQSASAKRRKANKETPSEFTAAPTRIMTPGEEDVLTPDADAPTVVRLRLMDGTEYLIESSQRLKRFAMQWVYVVRNRGRWSETEAARNDLSERVRQGLEELGLELRDLERIAEAGTVEVSIPYHTEEVGWETRILPWEYMLSTATKSFRGNTSLTVIRHFDGPLSQPSSARPVNSLLVVESAPGRLANAYVFESERELVMSNLALPKSDKIINPTLAELAGRLQTDKPDVLHVAGIDRHEGDRFLNIADKEASRSDRRDGMYLMGADGSPQAVDAVTLNRTLFEPLNPKPVLVSFNFYNSGARLAPMALAYGVGAAIGFQDEIDNAAAELFFANFYWSWRQAKWDLLSAFRVALNELRQQANNLTGAGVVLWSAQSLLQSAPQAKPKRTHRKAAAAPAKSLTEQLQETRSKVVISTGTGEGSMGALLKAEVKAFDKVNYSLLHNNRGLFKSFTLHKFTQQRINNIKVEVVLYVGSESFPYRTSFNLEKPVLDVAPLIKVALTSALSRSIREGVHTSLYVSVACNGEEIYCETHRVTLLAVDEWQDDGQSTFYLPSFVLPRDPAVAQITDKAQKYLMALEDDPGAGFDGYQTPELIDMQVRALWAALSYDIALNYINPPPTFTALSQRLRTPCDVIDGHRGTCIDLALLLAACLEYVQIYPVIFLLKGHAFPGYWRSEAGHENFIGVKNALSAEIAGAGSEMISTGRDGQRYPWAVQSDAYHEIVQLVRNGDLVPLETVWLTQHKSFCDAIEGGLENLRNQREFDAMIDIRKARINDVTPLPITGKLL
jgi:hypothetical protein